MPTTDPLGWLDGQTVLVTGGTGSFGGAILRRLLTSTAREIRVFSRDEQKHVVLERAHHDSRVRHWIGDVRDMARVAQATRGADVVFHAAALKHVHTTEMHPYEAVLTNVVGAENVARACVDAGVRHLIAVSTDKAVQPVNVMGMTKALQERLVCAASGQGKLKAGCVRYGNVLASNGSVVPYFAELLRAGHRVLPVTDAAMTRFMLTLDGSIDLVFYAGQVIEDGEIVVADLPAFRVIELAEVMLEAYGGGRVDLVGTRPGEKLHEALLSDEESCRTERREGFFVVRRHASARDRYGGRTGSYTSDAVRTLSREELREILMREGFLP
jgi:UDP-N-acetylglucosamine 4,6-dehydratase